MKKSLFSFNHTAGMLLLLVLMSGCKAITDMTKVEPFANVTYKLKYQPAKTLVQGLIVDAKTGVPLSVPVKILITGKDAGRIVTFEGKALRDFTADRGSLYLGLTGAVPSVLAPAEIKVVADAEGYIPSSATVPLIQELNAPFTIRLVKESAPPAGVGVKTEALPASTAAGLTTAKQITVSAPATATGAPVQATIEFSKNTILRDDKGNPVITTVTATVSSYSTSSQTAMSGTPDKINVELAKDASGQVNGRATLLAAGFVAIELNEANGNKVTSFSNPVTLTTSISSDFIHPITKQKVKAGDELQVYVYNEKTGVWTYEQMTKVESQGAGLAAKMQVTHFSEWLVGWNTTDYCGQRNFTIKGLPSGISFVGMYQIDYGTDFVNDTSFVFGVADKEGTAVAFFGGAPLNVTGKKMAFEIFTPWKKSLYKYSGPLCDLPSILQVSIPELKNTVSVEATVKVTCENGKKIEVTVPTYIYYDKVGSDKIEPDKVGSLWYGLEPFVKFGTDGKGTFAGLEPNTEYYGRLYYDENELIQPFKTGATNSTMNFEYKIKGDQIFCK